MISYIFVPSILVVMMIWCYISWKKKIECVCVRMCVNVFLTKGCHITFSRRNFCLTGFYNSSIDSDFTCSTITFFATICDRCTCLCQDNTNLLTNNCFHRLSIKCDSIISIWSLPYTQNRKNILPKKK